MARRLVLAVLAASILTTAVTGTVVVAQSDVIKTRQGLLKEFGRVTKPIGGMLKGEPFNLATVQTALDTYVKNAKELPNLFPEGSGTGDTGALPAIWAAGSDFKARFAKFETDAVAARAAITDEASFKATMPGLIRQCGGCHDSYRKKS